MDDKYECPICLGAKQFFTGRDYTTCDLCDDNGNVSRETYELYCGVEDDEELI